MRAPEQRELTAADARRLARWHKAGRPPVPVFVDRDGVVHATTTSLATILRHRFPTWEPFRRTAARWVDQHCRE